MNSRRLIPSPSFRATTVDQTITNAQDGRIYIEKTNGPFLFGDKATPVEYSACLKFAIERGWLTMHESGTFVRFTQSGSDLFA